MNPLCRGVSKTLTRSTIRLTFKSVKEFLALLKGWAMTDKLFQITVAVAQLAERQVVVLDVAGSSPVGHPFRFWILDLRFSI